MSFSSDFYTFSTFKQNECLSKTKDILVYTLCLLLLSVFLTILFILVLFILTLEQKNYNYINNSTNFETVELFVHEDLI